eukprot:748533-Hanusia_phi.AAC.2
MPDVSSSLPPKWYPCSTSVSEIACTELAVDANAVASANFPFMSAAFPPSISSSLPTVMREGNPWGFMMRSGQRPSSVKGMSSWGMMMPVTPFCPCLDENLSPSSGRRVVLISTFTRKCSSWLEVRRTWST